MMAIKFHHVIILSFVVCFLVGCSGTEGSSQEDEQDSKSPSVSTRFHPLGYAVPSAHGPDLRKVDLDCRACHGSKLEGNIGPSCDSCHGGGGALGQQWRRDCTFCHGGEDDDSGAPPNYLSGRYLPGENVFRSHQNHIHSSLTANISCTQCHKKIDGVLTPQHVFDSTPGDVEVDMTLGYSVNGLFQPEVGCSESYCHGGGTDNGFVSITQTTLACDSCHASIIGGDSEKMSGFHTLHLSSNEDITCRDCHSKVTRSNFDIINKRLHINGQTEVEFLNSSISFDKNNGSCSGRCHSVSHSDYVWREGRFHSADYAKPNKHGYDMVFQTLDCRNCHGEDLSGGIANSCDQCHGANGGYGTQWRTDCTFCHGGVSNSTGAPPSGLGGVVENLPFGAHTAHVEAILSSPLGCEECHPNPNDVLSENHAFDDTPRKSELDYSAGLSPAIVRDVEARNCSNAYCHGDGLGDNGSATIGDILNCDSCHNRAELAENHLIHTSQGINCGECHADVTEDGLTINKPALHVNRQKDVRLSEGTIFYDSSRRTCAGSCHGKLHQKLWW